MLTSMAIRAICTVAGAGVTLGGLAATSPVRAQASVIEQLVKESHLTKIKQSRTLRVCQYPQYYSISFRNPATGQLEGIDADLAKELAKDLGVKLEVVESSFVTFIDDLQTNKCDIGMFAVGATLARAKAVEFSKPYLVTSIFDVVKKNAGVYSEAAGTVSMAALAGRPGTGRGGCCGSTQGPGCCGHKGSSDPA